MTDALRQKKRKADFFIKHYSGVSKIDMSKEGRTKKKKLKISLRELLGHISSVPNITECELREALKTCGQRGLSGSTTSLHFLKSSVPKQSKYFFTHQIFQISKYSQVWLNANIIPLLKANKPPFDIGSFRTISITSCVGMLLERMISARMYSICERNGLKVKCVEQGSANYGPRTRSGRNDYF